MSDALVFAIGLLVSAFGTTIGFGGSVFMVPILIIFFHFPVPIAIGSATAALLPASLISSFYNFKDKNIDYLVASLIQVPAVGGTIIGAYLVAFVPVKELQITFAVFVFAVAAYMFMPNRKRVENQKRTGMMYRIRRMPTSFIRKNRQKKLAYRLNGSVVTFFGLFSGTIAGLFGIGGGFLQTPVMMKLFKMPAPVAVSTSLFIVVITSLTGFFTHAMLGHVWLEQSIWLVLGFMCGAFIGRKLKKSFGAGKKLEKLIGFGLLLAGTGMLLNLLFK